MDLDAILRCPRCKGPIDHQATRYACRACKLAYPIVNGVASFIPSDASPLDDDHARRDADR